MIGATERRAASAARSCGTCSARPSAAPCIRSIPSAPSVLGIQAYRDIARGARGVDLAVITTPAPRCPASSRNAVDAGCAGRHRHLRRLQGARRGRQGAGAPDRARSSRRQDAHHRPQLPGRDEPADRPERHLRRAMARPGNVGFISQSGALCTAILDWSLREIVGFSAFVSVGSMLDVGWGDLIDYLGDDPRTHSIVIYMESIGDARSFLSAAREVVAHQADHRDQGRAAPPPPRRPPPRTPGRSPAATKCSTPPSAACGVLRVQHDRRPLLHGRSAGQAAAPARPAALPSSPTPAVPACWPPTP